MNVLSKAGVNWEDLDFMSKSGVNWSDMSVLSKAGVNWEDLESLTKAGVNWEDMDALSRAGVNWSGIRTLSIGGVNWLDLGFLSKSGVNWSDLIFTSHIGQIFGKEADLEAHRLGIVRIRALTPSEQRILLLDGVAVVSVRMHVVGTYADTPQEADLRYTRVWAALPGDLWQVVAGHASVIA